MEVYLVNAAFLLVTTAWFAGDCGPAPCATDCCTKPKLCDKLHDLFKRKDCCEPCKTCEAPKPPPPPKCETCAPACDSCAKPKLMDRLKACFHKDKCCDTPCDACSAPAVTPKTGEMIPTPPAKKMPSSGKEPPPAKGVQLQTPPSANRFAPTIEAVPNAIQAPPAIAPSVEADNLRNPF
jgi:hypothetical protein